MIVLGLSGGFGHEAAACLVIDGVVSGMVEEERLSRRKHATDQPPRLSIRWCVDNAGIDASDIDIIAFSWEPARDETDLELAAVRDAVLADPVWRGSPPAAVTVPHHLAHAASTFWPSGYTDATVIVVDGNGENVATTIWHGTESGIKSVHQEASTHSLGHLYNAVTEFTGLGRSTAAGKLMGLASYGTPRFELPHCEITATGYRLDIPEIEDLPSPQRFIELRQFWRRALQDRFGEPMSAGQWDALPPKLVPQHHADVAATAQAFVTAAVGALASTWTRQLGMTRVAMAGGVALNCTANGALARSDAVSDLFVCPAAHDAGGALGAALWASADAGDNVQRNTAFSPFLGPRAAGSLAADSARERGFTAHSSADIASETATRLVEGEIIGWVQGNAEVGPRALGARSILASPVCAETRDRVNALKHREWWRPLSPSLSQHEADNRLAGIVSPYMLLAVGVDDATAAMIPAVVHVDGSCRPQTVDGSLGDPRYDALLGEVGGRQGVAAVLNTSFNLAGEPIVSSALDAVDVFERSGLDALVVDDVLITR
jgi:carbamoyltransferase